MLLVEMENNFAVRVRLENCICWDGLLESLIVVDFAVDAEDLLFVGTNEWLSTRVCRSHKQRAFISTHCCPDRISCRKFDDYSE